MLWKTCQADFVGVMEVVVIVESLVKSYALYDLYDLRTSAFALLFILH